MHSAFDADRRNSVRELEIQLEEQGAHQHWTTLQTVADTKRQGPWPTAKRAWRYGLTGTASHHLVLQDDIRVCDNFVTLILDVIAVQPDQILSLFCGPRKAFDGSRPWGIMESPWGQGIVLPAPTLKSFLEWEEINVKSEWPHDDARIGLYCKAHAQRVWVPFPTLIEHRDAELKSVQGNAWNKPRVSPDFLGSKPPPDWRDTKEPMHSINSYTQHNHALVKHAMLEPLPASYQLDDRQLIIRPITEAEAKTLNQFKPDRKLVSIRQRADTILYIGGFINDDLVGCAQLVKRGATKVELNGAYVRDDYRRCGINGFLILYRLEAARQAGYSQAVAYTTSVSGYLAHGFEILSDVKEKGPHHTWVGTAL